MILSAFLASLSVPAKAVAAVSIAATSLGGAAAAGVPVAQDVVSAVTPVEFHDNSNDNADHGENVSKTARDTELTGKDKGEAVSTEAKKKGEEMGQDGDHPSGAPTDPGSAGLEKANENAPDSAPATPAAGADNKPADTPAGPPAEAAGPPDTTPASTAPVSTPAGPPAGGTPASAPAGVPVDRP